MRLAWARASAHYAQHEKVFEFWAVFPILNHVEWLISLNLVLMVEFVFPNSRALLLTFCTNCPDGSHFAQMGSHSAQSTTTNPVLYSAVTYPFQGYVHTQNTLNPTPKHPIFWPELESGQNEQLSWQNGPQLGKMWKVSKSFLEVGKKNYSSGNWVRPTTRNCLIFGLQRKLMMFSQPFSKFLTMQPKKKTSLE